MDKAFVSDCCSTVRSLGNDFEPFHSLVARVRHPLELLLLFAYRSKLQKLAGGEFPPAVRQRFNTIDHALTEKAIDLLSAGLFGEEHLLEAQRILGPHSKLLHAFSRYYWEIYPECKQAANDRR